MRTVTAVNGEWLAELGPMFFSVKEDYATRLKRKAREREVMAQAEEEMKEQEERANALERDKLAASATKMTESLIEPGAKRDKKKQRRIGF
jgi:pre-mRNA-splicing factor ATP-dependent RNA helicase DHX38/PRP16